MAKKVVVIRIGAKTIHIAHMDNALNNPTVYGCVRVPTPDESVREGMIVDIASVGRRVRKACLEKGIKTKDVIFTIASSKIASRETTIPVVNKQKIQQLVMAKVPDLFPIDTEKYIFSYVMQGKPREDGENGKVQDVLVFAAPTDLIDSYYALARALGMNILALEADGNGVFQIMKRQVKEGVTMALQINRDSTMVNIISADKLLLQRVVPYGVNVFTEVMNQEDVFQTPDYQSAYKVLTTQRVLLHSLNAENPENDYSLEKRIDVTDNASYLIGNISRVIEYYNSRYKDQPITEVICTGQGCSVAGIHELLSNELGVTVTTPDMISGVRFNRKIDIDAAILQYINCFGAVFNPVCFVSREAAAREAKKGSFVGPILIFAGCFLLGVVLAGFSILQVVVNSDERDFWKAKNEAMAPIQNEYDELMKIDTNYNVHLMIKDLVDTNNNKFHKLIDKISSMVPKSFRIQSVESDEQKVTISGISADKLSSLPVLQMQLNKVKEISDVKLDEIAETKDEVTGKRQYSYTLTFIYAVETTEGEVQ